MTAVRIGLPEKTGSQGAASVSPKGPQEGILVNSCQPKANSIINM